MVNFETYARLIASEVAGGRRRGGGWEGKGRGGGEHMTLIKFLDIVFRT